jgi:hypothetical protein
MKVMKKQLIEQIDGLEQIIHQARQTKTNKIFDVFKETFDLKDVEYSNLNVSSERAEFYFNEDRWGSFTVHFNEPWGGSETKLEINTPSFNGTNASRLIQWGKIAEKIFEKGDEFLVKLAFIREEHKKGIEVVFAKLAEAKNKLKDIEDKEYKADFILTKTALETVGRTFERGRWIQVGAQSSIHTNGVRIEKVKGAKTYNIHHINFNKQQVTYGRVREMYINKLITDLVFEDRKNA